MKEKKDSYLSFSKRERNGVITLLISIAVVSFLPVFFRFFSDKNGADKSGIIVFSEEIQSLQVKMKDSTDLRSGNNFYESRKPYAGNDIKTDMAAVQEGGLFYFDPNTLNSDGWRSLGIRDKTIQTIQHYLQKGGRFYQPSDIAKIWGIHEDEVRRLLPYIRISPLPNQKSENKSVSGTLLFEKSTREISRIEINTADTTQFISLPGIGSRLSQRIIAYRNKLGGFYRIEQVAETYGLPDSVFRKISPRLFVNAQLVRKININTATSDEMKEHPYVRYAIANTIIRYRLQHGIFRSVEDVKKIMAITEDWYAKASPYLTVE